MTTGQRDEEAVGAFVEQLAMTFADWGFPRMPARVLVSLMAADEESLTAGELGERLGVSPAAISGAVRYLVHIGMLERQPAAGSRRDRYRLPVDPWYESASLERGLLTRLADIADGGASVLGGQGTRAGDRVTRMRDFFLFMAREMETLMAKWRAERP